MSKSSTGRILSADDLKVFLEVAQVLNMTRASERVGLSQPALSHAIRRMEDQLSISLFLRSKKGLKLTRAGEKLRDQGQGLLRAWENLHRELQSDEERVAGFFRFGCHPSVMMYAVPGPLRELQKKYPEIDIQLKHGLSRHIAEGIISGGIDLGYVMNPPAHPDLVIRQIMTDEVYLWSNPKQEPPDVLIYDPEMIQAQWLLREMEKKKIRFRKTIESSSLEVIRELTMQGCGYGIIPSRVAALAKGLEKSHPQVAGYKDRLCIVHRLDIEKTAAFRALLKTFMVE